MFVVLMARLETHMKIVTGVVILLSKYSPVRRDFSFISLFFNKNNTNKAKITTVSIWAFQVFPIFR